MNDGRPASIGSGFSRLGALLPWLAPATAALTGMLYISGAARTNVLIGASGMPRGTLNLSIDRTLATGYTPFVFLIIIFCLEAATISILGALYSFVAGKISPEWLGHPVRFQRKLAKKFLGSRYITSMILANYALILLTVGFVAGSAFGSLESYLSSYLVQEKCNEFCMVYMTEDRTIVGIPLIGDDDVSVIRTYNGIELVKTDDLKKINPFVNRPSFKTVVPIGSMF